MAYTRDDHAYTRGAGAIAAIDGHKSARRRALEAKANRLAARRDRSRVMMTRGMLGATPSRERDGGGTAGGGTSGGTVRGGTVLTSFYTPKVQRSVLKPSVTRVPSATVPIERYQSSPSSPRGGTTLLTNVSTQVRTRQTAPAPFPLTPILPKSVVNIGPGGLRTNVYGTATATGVGMPKALVPVVNVGTGVMTAPPPAPSSGGGSGGGAVTGGGGGGGSAPSSSAEPYIDEGDGVEPEDVGTPAQAPTGMSTGKKVAIGVGALALLWLLTRKKKG